jgi:hypothetical protein
MRNWFKELDKDDFREAMAAVSLILGFGFLYAIVFIPLSPSGERFADIGLGMVGTVIFGRVFEYYFGNGQSKKSDSE